MIEEIRGQSSFTYVSSYGQIMAKAGKHGGLSVTQVLALLSMLF